MRKLNTNYQIGFVFLLIVALCGGVLFGLSMKPKNTPTTYNFPTIPVPTPFASPEPSPLPTPATTQTDETSWTTPNGASTLVMKTLIQPSGQKMYSFYVSTATEPERHLIFTRTVQSPVRMFIPFNSWSPDNKHFFVQEDDGTEMKTFVFRASGETFKDGEQVIDVNKEFAQKNTDYLLKETTGWAAPTLLIINSKKANGEDGPSYWLDINTRKLIRLSTSFQ